MRAPNSSPSKRRSTPPRAGFRRSSSTPACRWGRGTATSPRRPGCCSISSTGRPRPFSISSFASSMPATSPMPISGRRKWGRRAGGIFSAARLCGYRNCSPWRGGSPGSKCPGGPCPTRSPSPPLRFRSLPRGSPTARPRRRSPGCGWRGARRCPARSGPPPISASRSSRWNKRSPRRSPGSMNKGLATRRFTTDLSARSASARAEP